MSSYDSIDPQDIIKRLERLIEYFEKKQREAKIKNEKELKSPYMDGK